MACGRLSAQIHVLAVGTNLPSSCAGKNVMLGEIVKPMGGSSSAHVTNINMCCNVISPRLQPKVEMSHKPKFLLSQLNITII